eukprot:665796-Pleurochrysis_carterae.AAC.3
MSVAKRVSAKAALEVLVELRIIGGSRLRVVDTRVLRLGDVGRLVERCAVIWRLSIRRGGGVGLRARCGRFT